MKWKLDIITKLEEGNTIKNLFQLDGKVKEYICEECKR
jgi:hypothetical protein